jgi:hypothetical protein
MMHAHGDDVLVVRAVEHDELAPSRQLRVHAPQVVVRELGRRRHPERDHPQPLRADPREDRADHTVLAGGIEPLEHEEQAARPFGKEAVLEHVEPLAEFVEELLPAGLVQSERVTRIAVRDPRRQTGLDPELGDHSVDGDVTDLAVQRILLRRPPRG